MNRFFVFAAGAASLVATLSLDMSRAEACGCFAPPDPTVPVVQAGERILFGIEDGVVTAHIQIQFGGADGQDFGWLVPLPSVPEVSVGTDEVFTQLTQSTQPLYRLNTEFEGNCLFGPRGGTGASGDSSGQNAPSEEGDPGPGAPPLVVIQSSAGPYDFAVLRADSKEPMLEWLAENGYFVPVGTEDVVDPYIRPGGYFLALKLQPGQSAGDIQPVVLEYESDLPMVPLVLTSVAADPDMGVQVWVVGDARAIPRNFFHTHINDMLLNWLDGAQNYVDVLTDAVDEADGHHSFVTEYAGTSSVMLDRLDWDGRFGNVDQLATLTEAIPFIQYLRSNGYPFTSQLLSILQNELPVPSGLADTGVDAVTYYFSIEYYLGPFKDDNPDLFTDLDLEFDSAAMAIAIDERIVEPSMKAGKMFRDYPYLTRMFTTISPDEMTKDPVFSFNPDLEEVSNTHEGTMTYHCGVYADDPNTTPATIVTEQGNVLHLRKGTDRNPWLRANVPYSQRIEILREEGPPEVVTDNRQLISDYLDSGCSVAGNNSSLMWSVFATLGLLAFRRRRTRR